MNGLEVKHISYEDTKPFLLQIHYARRMPCIQYAFGLFDNDKIIGVCTYGQPASPSLCKGLAGEENRKNVLELNRLALLPDCPKNSASFFGWQFIKKAPKRFVYSVLCRCRRLGTYWIRISSN